MSGSHARLIVVADSNAVAAYAAEAVVTLADESIRSRGRFTIALSGGGTPKKLHDALASAAFRKRIDWSCVFVFWGDERFVVPTNAASNQRMARETLLSKVPIPEDQIFAMPTDGTPFEAAATYERTLVHQLGETATLDLVILGIGEDGHTASLFPGQCSDHADAHGLVKAVTDSPKPPPSRLTLTFEALRRAHNVLFLVTGPNKSEALRGILDPGSSVNDYPALAVRPTGGSLSWVVDRAAYGSVD